MRIYAKNEDTHPRDFKNYFFLYNKKKKRERKLKKKGTRIIGNNEVDITPSAEAKDI